MASHKVCTARGFTLVEVLVVIGILAIVAACCTLGVGSFQGGGFRAERDVLLASLMHARAQAQHAVCDAASCTGALPHGVYVRTDASGRIMSAVLFEGSAYDPNDALNVETPLSGSAVLAGSNTVIFEPFSGDAMASGTLSLTSGSQSAAITIGD